MYSFLLLYNSIQNATNFVQGNLLFLSENLKFKKFQLIFFASVTFSGNVFPSFDSLVLAHTPNAILWKPPTTIKIGLVSRNERFSAVCCS